MGCDIHCFVEAKVDNKWYLVHQPQLERDYRLFAKMANVRNDENIDYIDNPRGLPDDISNCVQLAWRLDQERYLPHSPSWLSLDEWIDVYRFHKEQFQDFMPRYQYVYRGWGYVFGLVPGELKEYIEEHKNIFPFDDFRLVFWFDN